MIYSERAVVQARAHQLAIPGLYVPVPSRIAHAISAEVLPPSADRVNLILLSFR